MHLINLSIILLTSASGNTSEITDSKRLSDAEYFVQDVVKL